MVAKRFTHLIDNKVVSHVKTDITHLDCPVFTSSTIGFVFLLVCQHLGSEPQHSM